MKNKTYKMPIKCFNCLNIATIKIPKGVKSLGYAFICPECGVASVIKEVE